MGVRKTVGKVSGGKATGAQFSQETGGKGDRLMGESEDDNSMPGDNAAGQNVTEGIQRKSYSEAVIEGVRKRASVFVGDSIVRKTNRALNKGDDMVVSFFGRAGMFMNDGLHLSGKGQQYLRMNSQQL